MLLVHLEIIVRLDNHRFPAPLEHIQILVDYLVAKLVLKGILALLVAQNLKFAQCSFLVVQDKLPVHHVHQVNTHYQKAQLLALFVQLII